MSNPKRNDPFAELFGEAGDRLRGDRWRPDVDVFETEHGVVVRAEIAGIEREDLRVTVDGQRLRISGVRRALHRSDMKRLHQMELATGPFERVVHVPIAFQRDRVAAHLTDGILTVTLPRRVTTRRTIEVESKA